MSSDYSDFLELYAHIICREKNVCVAAVYKLSLVSKGLNEILQHSMQYYHRIYLKYAGRLAHGYYRRLINHPIDYTHTNTRVISVPNLNNNYEGVEFLNSDPPVFTQDFLQRNVPALTNLCIIMEECKPFYYNVKITDAVIVSGYVSREQIIDIGEDRRAARGRYFVDLQLPFVDNPILLRSIGVVNNLRIAVSEVEYSYDFYGELIHTVISDINLIVTFTHVIAQFKTISTELFSTIPTLGIYCGIPNTHVKKFSLIRNVESTDARLASRRCEQYDLEMYIDTAADHLLNTSFDMPELLSSDSESSD